MSEASSPTPPAASASAPNVVVRLAGRDDAAATREIYNFEVENHTTTLDMIPRSLDDQIAWIGAREGAFSAVVAELAPAASGLAERRTGPRRDSNTPAGLVVGFASLSPFRDRPAYNTTVENSVYVSRDHSGLGIGRELMNHLIERARDTGFHSMIARIESSGPASIALHRACGFGLIGVEREVGRKHGRWLDMTVMQLML